MTGKTAKLFAQCIAKRRNLLGFAILIFSFGRLSSGQSAASTPSQFQAAKLQAYSALVSTAKPTSILLNGTFASTSGPSNSGESINLTVGSDGSYSVNFSQSAGPISEARTVTSGTPACAWTDQNNTAHQSSFSNCLFPPWFFPGLMLLSPGSDPTLPWLGALHRSPATPLGII